MGDSPRPSFTKTCPTFTSIHLDSPTFTIPGSSNGDKLLPFHSFKEDPARQTFEKSTGQIQIYEPYLLNSAVETNPDRLTFPGFLGGELILAGQLHCPFTSAERDRSSVSRPFFGVLVGVVVGVFRGTNKVPRA